MRVGEEEAEKEKDERGKKVEDAPAGKATAGRGGAARLAEGAGHGRLAVGRVREGGRGGPAQPAEALLHVAPGEERGGVVQAERLRRAEGGVGQKWGVAQGRGAAEPRARERANAKGGTEAISCCAHSCSLSNIIGVHQRREALLRGRPSSHLGPVAKDAAQGVAAAAAVLVGAAAAGLDVDAPEGRPALGPAVLEQQDGPPVGLLDLQGRCQSSRRARRA